MIHTILGTLIAGWLACVFLTLWRVWLASIALIALLWFAGALLQPGAYQQQQPIMPFSQRWAFTEPHQ